MRNHFIPWSVRGWGQTKGHCGKTRQMKSIKFIHFINDISIYEMTLVWFLKSNSMQGCTLAVARSLMRPENQSCDLGFLSGRRPCDQLLRPHIRPLYLRPLVLRPKWLNDFFSNQSCYKTLDQTIFFQTNLAIRLWTISMKKKNRSH